MNAETLITALASRMPPIMRYAGGIARQLRQFNIALDNKASTNPHTDALTLADLTIQDFLVSALRDSDPIFRHCRLDVEETSGDLHFFASEAEYTIALDPIDGTKKYRDKTGCGYAVILSLRSLETVLYSLVYLPERGINGSWIEVRGKRIVYGSDDKARNAIDVLSSLPAIDASVRPDSKKIYLLGFQNGDSAKSKQLSQAGFEGVLIDDIGKLDNIYEMYAHGSVGGALIHTPNVYDFPVLVHIARVLRGDAVWVDTGEPIHFKTIWKDERSAMLRLPGIVACGVNHGTLNSLCETARGWNPVRYAE